MIRYKPRGQYSGVMDEHKDGDFVLHTEAQAEIDALHAECDRLTAILEPQKMLYAEQITEPGFYWWRWRATRWVIVVARYDDQKIVIKAVPGDEIFLGQFIGPLKAPEV